MKDLTTILQPRLNFCANRLVLLMNLSIDGRPCRTKHGLFVRFSSYSNISPNEAVFDLFSLYKPLVLNVSKHNKRSRKETLQNTQHFTTFLTTYLDRLSQKATGWDLVRTSIWGMAHV